MTIETRAVIWLEAEIALAEASLDYWRERYGLNETPDLCEQKIAEKKDRLAMLQYLSGLAVEAQNL